METTGIWIIKKAPAWFISWAFRKIFGKKSLAVFERLLEIPEWKKVSYSPEKWIFEDDNSFTIEVSENTRDFEEVWTNHFPDKASHAVEVSLKIGGELVTTPLLFVGVDGWRYFVPCPKQGEAYNERYFYWSKDSLEYKVFQVVGQLDRLSENLDGFAKRCGVRIM